MILLQQLSELVKLVHDDMSKGQSGTSNTLFDKSQGGLISPVSATNLTLSNKTFTNSSITCTYVISTSVGNGNTYYEFEINNGVYSYNRGVKGGFSKTSDIEATVIHTFKFELVV